MAAHCGLMTLEAPPAEWDLWQVWLQCTAPGLLADTPALRKCPPEGLLDMSPIAKVYRRLVFLVHCGFGVLLTIVDARFQN